MTDIIGMTKIEMALDYYKSGVLHRKPQFVPSVVELHRTIRSDIPAIPRVFAKPGLYDALSNPWGAISVETSSGQLLGIKPDEFKVIEWQINPHLKEKAEHES